MEKGLFSYIFSSVPKIFIFQVDQNPFEGNGDHDQQDFSRYNPVEEEWKKVMSLFIHIFLISKEFHF